MGGMGIEPTTFNWSDSHLSYVSGSGFRGLLAHSYVAVLHGRHKVCPCKTVGVLNWWRGRVGLLVLVHSGIARLD